MTWHTLITSMDNFVATHAPELVVVVPAFFVILFFVTWHLGFLNGMKERKLDIIAAIEVLDNIEVTDKIKINWAKRLLKGVKHEKNN